LASTLALGAVEQARVTALLLTVKLVVQEALLPAASVAVTVISYVPGLTRVPATGDWLIMIAPAAVQLSLTLAATVGIGARQLASALALGSVGQTTLGGVLSITVKLVVQLALLPAASVAVTVMVCVPKPSRVPAAGD